MGSEIKHGVGSAAIADQRHLLEALLFELLLDLAALGGDDGRVGAHADFDVGGAEFEGDVDTAHLAALENDVVGHKCLEAGMGGAQFVAAAGQVQDFEVAIFVGDDCRE